VSAAQDFLLADCKDHGSVELECIDRGATGRGLANNSRAFPLEMIAPTLASRMKQRDDTARQRVGGRAARFLA
jgi:hypothetical protein